VSGTQSGLGLNGIDAESISTGGQTAITVGQQSGFVGIDVKSAVELTILVW